MDRIYTFSINILNLGNNFEQVRATIGAVPIHPSLRTTNIALHHLLSQANHSALEQQDPQLFLEFPYVKGSLGHPASSSQGHHYACLVKSSCSLRKLIASLWKRICHSNFSWLFYHSDQLLKDTIIPQTFPGNGSECFSIIDEINI